MIDDDTEGQEGTKQSHKFYLQIRSKMVATPAKLPPSSIGFSFSPGGLLFPYHLGVITGLSELGRLPDSTHLAGSSAGSIAVASHAAKTPPAKALEAAFRVCDVCETEFGGKAVGKLLPLLKMELEKTFSDEAHEIINEREGVVALAHRELFPNNRPVLTTQFDTRDDLIEAVCDSSMFPFFSTPFPVRLKYKEGERLPRVIVDGFFSVPRERYGCPDFSQLNFDCVDKGDECYIPPVERTITVACFPHETVGLSASEKHDQISPEPDYDNPVGQMGSLFRYATAPSSRKELEELYEKGFVDAEKWCYEEELREKELLSKWLDEQRQKGEMEEAIKRGDLF